MLREHAHQIAELINSRNELTIVYDSNMILERRNNIIYELLDEVIVACIEVKKVQWYQWEVCHLTVAEKNERRGLGSLMIRKAEERAKAGGARIIQCTIRCGNTRSEGVFDKNGYNQVSEFYYPTSGNNVAVRQKVVSHQPLT